MLLVTSASDVKRLMRAGRVEEAKALAEHIGKEARRCEVWLSKVDGKVNSKGM